MLIVMRIVIAFMLWMFAVTNAHSQQASLSVAPNKCVALKKGQTCYQSILIQIKITGKSDFCLTVNEQLEPLQCWSDSEVAEFRYSLASSSGVEFKVIDSNKDPLATGQVTVAWVYKRPRKRNRWRLF